MATLDELKARRETLRRQRHSGVARVGLGGGRSIEYRGDHDIAGALEDLDRQIAALEGTKPVRQIRPFASKGV